MSQPFATTGWTNKMNPIQIQLAPDPDEFGRLQDAQTGDIAATREFAKHVSVIIYTPIIVSGRATFDGVSHAATLLVFSVNATSEHDKKRFKRVTVEFTFTEAGAVHKAENFPAIVDLAPDSRGLFWQETSEDWVDTTTWELNAKVGAEGGGGTGEAGGSWQHSREKSLSKDFAARVVGTRSESEDSDGMRPTKANVGRWTIKENTSEGDGVPGLVRFAVLLTRPQDGDFECTVSIEANVDWPTNKRSAIVDAFSRTPSVIQFKKTDKATEGREFDDTKMEQYTNRAGSMELKKLSSIKPPQKLEDHGKE